MNSENNHCYYFLKSDILIQWEDKVISGSRSKEFLNFQENNIQLNNTLFCVSNIQNDVEIHLEFCFWKNKENQSKCLALIKAESKNIDNLTDFQSMYNLQQVLPTKNELICSDYCTTKNLDTLAAKYIRKFNAHPLICNYNFLCFKHIR